MQNQVTLEQMILAYLLKYPQKVNEISDIFLSVSAKDLYQAIKKVVSLGKEFKVVNVIAFCEVIHSDVARQAIDALQELEFDSESIDDYIDQLRQYKIQEVLRTEIAADIVKSLDTTAKPDIKKFKENVYKSLDIISKIEGTSTNILTLDDWLSNYEKVLYQRTNGDSTYPIGDPHLDPFFPMGLAPGYMTTIFGASGTGKSTVGLHIVNSQINRLIPCVWDLLEMDSVSTMDRLFARRTGIDYDFFLTQGEYDADKYDMFQKLIKKEKDDLKNNSRFLAIEDDEQSIKDLDLMIPDLQKRLGSKYFVLHIDLATMLKEFNLGKDKQSTAYEQAGNQLHSLAKKHGIHIINYVQALRDQHHVTIKKMKDLKKFEPRLNSIKNSAIFEERSRVVLGLFRPYYYAERYLPDDPQFELLEDIMYISVLKQSMGKLPKIRYYFDGARSTLYPYDVPAKDDLTSKILSGEFDDNKNNEEEEEE